MIETTPESPLCGCCNRPISKRDIELYNREGGPQNEIPACCEDCAEQDTCKRANCKIHPKDHP